MFIFAWIALILAGPAGADTARIVQIAPLERSFPFNRELGKNSGCVVSLHQPTRARVISETPTEFEVEWKTELTGCLWQQIWGQSLKRGFVRKRDIIWEESGAVELPMIPYPAAPEVAARPVDCLELGTQRFIPDPVKEMDIGGLIDHIRNEAGGIKPADKIDLYQRCYPFNKVGAANYQKYKKFLGLAGKTFRMTERREPQEVNPSLLSCLFRRESGFDEHTSGAAGIGQHTSVNIREISGRLRKPGSWESALWKRFFDGVKGDPDGRAALAACKGSSKTGEPVFDTKDDAMCPLQSIAAASIYILMIQRELSRNSKIYSVNWENELEYQTSIAAAYNLGEGAAGKAVKDLLVNDWVGAIRRMSTRGAPGKDCEVMLHINAVRNCMQASNPWQPMYYSERPQCEELKKVKIDTPARHTCVAWSAMKSSDPTKNLPKKLPSDVKAPPSAGIAAPAKSK